MKTPESLEKQQKEMYRRTTNVPKSLKERFWAKVNKKGPMPSLAATAIYPEIKGLRCWTWIGYTSEKEYGKVGIGGGKTTAAHRVAWFFAHGSWPTPCALHKCDNRACVRFNHLFEGTVTDNNQDREKKGRGVYRVGEASNLSKLTVSQVLQIRELSSQGKTQREIGKLFGTTHSNVGEIVRRESWRTV